MAVDTISQSIQKISHSVVDYAGKYAFRSPVIRQMLERLDNDPSLAGGMERLKYINEIKRKCSIITRWDLRETTYGLKFKKNDWNWSMGDGIEHITSNGTPIKVEKVYADMIVFEDKRKNICVSCRF